VQDVKIQEAEIITEAFFLITSFIIQKSPSPYKLYIYSNGCLSNIVSSRSGPVDTI
jgi:hypothetical protein